jgi:hypothetical protein
VGLLTVGLFSATAFLGAGGEEATEAEARFATKPHANSRAGYSFAYPPRWRLEDRGTLAEVTSPGREVSVSFGLGARGSLQRASLRFVEELDESYRKLTLSGFQLTLVDSEPAVSFTGSAVSDKGIPIRFQAISLAGPERNYSLVVFVAASAEPAEVLPPVEEILGSFRLTAETG